MLAPARGGAATESLLARKAEIRPLFWGNGEEWSRQDVGTLRLACWAGAGTIQDGRSGALVGRYPSVLGFGACWFKDAIGWQDATPPVSFVVRSPHWAGR